MGERTEIAWCDHTLNYWIGCTEVSPECDFCYARILAARYGWAKWGNDQPRRKTADSTVRQMFAWDRKAAKDGVKRKVFINSLSDTFDATAPQEWRDEIVLNAGNTPNLYHLILTKRPHNIEKLMPLKTANMWGGTTVGVNTSKSRIRHLRDSSFAVKFLSVEPLIEDLGELDLTGIHWVIVGGESGHGARPMPVEWARSIRDQCREQGVAFFFKQGSQANWKSYNKFEAFPEDLQIREFPVCPS